MNCLVGFHYLMQKGALDETLNRQEGGLPLISPGKLLHISASDGSGTWYIGTALPTLFSASYEQLEISY